MATTTSTSRPRRAAGIPVGNTPDVLTDATADLTFTLLLAAARKLPQAAASVQTATGDLGARRLSRTDVHGATLGIVGMGRIGRAVARRAEGFDMTVLHTGGGGVPLSSCWRALISSHSTAR